VPFSDILDNLSGAFMGRFGARSGRWGILLDVIWCHLEDSTTGPLGGTVSAEIQMFISELTGSYTVLERGEAQLRTYHHEHGDVEVFLEPHVRTATLVVVSATDVARELVRLAPVPGIAVEEEAVARGLEPLPDERVHDLVGHDGADRELTAAEHHAISHAEPAQSADDAARNRAAIGNQD